MTVAEVFTLDPDDIPPDRPEASLDVSPLRCQFDGCQNAVTKPARGRTPKFCDEHKRTGSTGTGKRNSWPMADTVERALTGYLTALGTGVTFVNPVDGNAIATGAGPVAHELVELGRADKRIRSKLELIATPGKYGPLAFASMPIVITIMANHKLLPQFVLGGTNTEPEGGE